VPAKSARRLVVDASVAGAAGGKTATAPDSTRCRDFLLTLRQETRCSVVMPPKLKDEWEKHRSVFAAIWLASMASHRRVIFDDVPPSNKMRREIEHAAATKQSEVKALRKDFHLIEAAIANDRIVVSLDEKVRQLFRTASQSVVAIKKVVWVNPVKTEEESVKWLQKGAKPENVRMLGYTAS
jgi:hypothetical protein